MDVNLPEATKRITFEYLKTGCEGYQILLQFINGDMKGDLSLYNTKVSYLPEGLKVGGDLNLSNTNITTLPNGLIVDGILDLEFSAIEELPNDLIVSGGVYIIHTPIAKKYTRQQLKIMCPNISGYINIPGYR